MPVIILWSIALAAGFFLTQALMPLIKPPSLSDLTIPQKERYLISLAYAYAYNKSLPDAIALMNDAGVNRPVEAYSDLLDQVASADDLRDAEVLSSLLVDLGGDVPSPIGTAIVLNLTELPTASDPPPDSSIVEAQEAQIILPATTTLAAADYSLTFESSCGVSGVPVVEVLVRDQSGFGVPGHTFELLIGDDEETVHTGLRAERDPGYLDFLLREGIVTTLNPISINDENHPFEIVPCISETGEDGFFNYMLTYVLFQEIP